MEVEEIQAQQQQPPCKFSRVGNNRNDSTKLGRHHRHCHPQDGEEENSLQLVKRPDYPVTLAGGGNEGIDMNNNGMTNMNCLRGWQHSSRIIRVSRASGGKDRHSKVLTSKGLRDRRVRLSVATAIQFYDLQDRLGYDQPSKAVEWLIKAAADAIADLPKLNGSIPPDDTSPNHHHQLRDDQKRREQLEAALDSVEADVDNVEQGNSQGQSQSQNQQQQQQQQHGSLSKSACSSTSETSKGSGMSLSRGNPKGNRVKARERARERTAKEKEKEKESDSSRVNNVHHHQQHQNVSPISQNSTFTELLTAGIGNQNHNAGGGGVGSPDTGSSEANLFHRVAAAARQWPLTPMDYLGSGILSGTPTVGRSGFSGQIQLGNSMPHGMAMSMLVPQPATPFSVSIGSGGESNNNSNHHHHQQLEQPQHFPFGSDHLILPLSTAAGGSGADYNLNFTISSSSSLAAGFNRGTLQSNSSSSTSSSQQSLLTHLQRFSATTTSASAISSSPMDGSANNVPFFIGGATNCLENHHNHHHPHQFPPGLQLLYDDGSRHSDHKGKGKS